MAQAHSLENLKTVEQLNLCIGQHKNGLKFQSVFLNSEFSVPFQFESYFSDDDIASIDVYSYENCDWVSDKLEDLNYICYQELYDLDEMKINHSQPEVVAKVPLHVDHLDAPGIVEDMDIEFDPHPNVFQDDMVDVAFQLLNDFLEDEIESGYESD